MNPASASTSETGRQELAILCAIYLRREELLLNAALPLVRAVKEAFLKHGLEAFAAALHHHTEFAGLSMEMQVTRQRFRESLARQLNLDAQDATVSRALVQLPSAAQAALGADIARLRRLAAELAATQYWISVHLRIHLQAYRRLLRDLTNTSGGSGRYGPAGNAEALEYDPLIQLRG